MLPKPSRLNLKNDFKWVASGKKIDTKFAIIFIKNGSNKLPKIGVATSSKYFKNATDRNRAKRVVSSAIEVLYPKFPDNINIVVLPKSNVTSVKSQDVLLDFKKALINYEHR